MQCLNVKSMKQIGTTTYEVRFRALFDVEYRPGQYIAIVSPFSKKTFYFSLTTAPLGDNDIVIHVGGVDGTSAASQLLSELVVANQAFCETIGGNAYLRESNRPIIMVMGGSGYSYAKGLLHAELASNRTREVILLWGGRSLDALYEQEILTTLSQVVERFTFVPVVSEGEQPSNGHIGNLLEVTYSLDLALESADLYVCGRPEMVKSFHEYCLGQAVEPKYFYSDAV